jgi:RNA polymerase sigma factor (sigma-70 family)
LADRELLRAYRETKAQDALGQIISRHTPRVYATCLRMLRDHHAAEDACQATFVIFCRRAEGLSEDGSLRAWLYETARLTATVHRRDQAIRRKHEAQAMRDATPVVPIPADGAEALSAELDQALGQLSPKLRQAVVLRHLEGLSDEEAAAELACPPGTLSARASRGLEKLRRYFGKRGQVVSVAALVAVMGEARAVEVPGGLAAKTLAICTGQVAAPAATLSANRGDKQA